MPADQRFISDGFARHFDLRLIMQEQFLTIEGGSQFLLQVVPLLQLHPHFGLKEHNRPARFGFGPIRAASALRINALASAPSVG